MSLAAKAVWMIERNLGNELSLSDVANACGVSKFHLARAFEAAVSHIDQAAGQVYNIGGGAGRTLTIWTETGPLLERLAGHPLPVRYSEWRPGDQRIYVSDISRARAELGWQPRVDPEEGVRRLWEWIQANKKLFG